MSLVAALILSTGLLLSLLSLPLIFRRVPPNLLYGVRTRAAFASDADWYRINAIGGRYLLRSGGVICLLGVVGFFLPSTALAPYGITAAVVTVVALLIPAFRLWTLKAVPVQ